MKYPKGKSGNPGGRPKGATGKTNQEIKATFQSVIERKLPKMNQLLKKVAAENPGAALNFVMKLSEYTLPKIKAIEQPAEPVDHSLKDMMALMQAKIFFSEEEEKMHNEFLRSTAQSFIDDSENYPHMTKSERISLMNALTGFNIVDPDQ